MIRNQKRSKSSSNKKKKSSSRKIGSSRSSPSQRKISLNDKLTLYLNDALSVENAAIERLQSRIKQTRLQDSKRRLQHHLEETREQQNRLKQLISMLDGTPTKDKAQLPIPSPPKSIMNILKKHMAAAEVDLKGAKEDAMVENAEIVLYDMLLQLAQKAAVDDAIPVLRQTLDEERNMADWIRANTPVMLTQLWPDIKASIIGGEIAEKEKEKV
jgi:ferritin-like metal-binding protein YciE